MRLRILNLSLVLLFSYPSLSQTSSILVLNHANVVNIRSGKIQHDAAVVIMGDKITAITPSRSVSIPTSARVVNARNGYLIPGLWDMHVHSEGDERVLRLMLAAGITGIRDMGGDVHKLADAKANVEAGNWSGPRVVFAGPLLNGPPGESDSDSWILHSPEEARSAVHSLSRLRVDFIKVHDRLARDVYFAIAAAAKENNLPFVGHVPASVTPIEASDAGQASIEHFEFLPKACVSLLGARAESPDHIPTECAPPAIESMLRHLAQNGTWLDPTLQSFRYFAPTQWKQISENFREIAGQIRSAHVHMMAGTDWSDFLQSRGALPGWCLHDELELWVAAGFTPLQALQAATLNPAIFLGLEDSLGSIETGKTANLLLVRGNPLVDIKNTRKIIAVIARGVLVEQASGPKK
jgi:imidazolonepropionase-like amidohydrolase